MPSNVRTRSLRLAAFCFSLLLLLPAATSGAEADDLAGKILKTTGVQGGLVVHLGCSDGKLTAALGADDRYLVHGLDPSAENVAAARRNVRAAGLYGRVSIEQLAGRRLPYANGLVNLVVVDGPGAVAMDEILRVLCPGGVACVRTGEDWKKSVKPRPENIDEWTHCLYDASNNAVSRDAVVGPPHQLQWVAGPAWSRSHDHLASLSAAVSSGGRIFYIVDEAPAAAVVLKPRWALVARDAASGVVLWKRPIDDWQWHLRGFRSGPADLARRLVAVSDRVYVTLGLDAPLSALDAATGETLATYQGTEGTREVLFDQGTLYVVAGEVDADAADARAKRRGERPGFEKVRSQRPGYPEVPPRKRLIVLDAETGKLEWKKSDASTAELMPTTAAVSGSRLFFQTPDEIVCLDAASGKEVWRAARPTSRSRPTWTAPTLVVYDDVVLSADRAVAAKASPNPDPNRTVSWNVASAGGQAPVGELIAFSAEDGQRLWSCPAKECYNAPIDVLVADGLVWTGKLVKASEPGITEGRDPKTGEVKRTRPADQRFFQPGMGHGRCHRNRATDRFLILGHSGVEFIDTASGRGIANHWTRGTCQYGVLFSDGLLYVPPHSCACFITSKLNDFNCFAPKRPGAIERPDPAGRLVRGPAYESDPQPSTLNSQPSDWPTYRHDAGAERPRRLGRACFPETRLVHGTRRQAQQRDGCRWEVVRGPGRRPDGSCTGCVRRQARLELHRRRSRRLAADDRSSRTDCQSVCQRRTEFQSVQEPGRIGNPSHILVHLRLGRWLGLLSSHQRRGPGLAIPAAPAEKRIVAYGRLESCWPVSGSVLVRDGVVYCAAGRSSYLEGGMRLCRLDAATGKLLSETAIDHRDPATGHQPKGVVHGTNMPGALPDVLSSEADSVYLRHLRFDLSGQPQDPAVPHLFAPAGFLDDSWWHRTYWLVGTPIGTNYGGWPHAGNANPAGRLLVVDDATVYGFGRSQYIHHGAHVGIDGSTVYHFRPPRDNDRRFTHYQAFAASMQSTPGGKRARQYRWTGKLPVLARAMLKAGENLFLAGPPDLFATDDPHGALAGTEGGRLVVLAASDGSEQAGYELDSPPIFDGMAAAGGRLYMATMDGRVVCFGAAK